MGCDEDAERSREDLEPGDVAKCGEERAWRMVRRKEEEDEWGGTPARLLRTKIIR